MRAMMKCAGIGLGVAALVAVVGGMFFAQHLHAQGGAGRQGGPSFGMGRGRGPGGPGFAGPLGPMMLNRLDLTQDQRDRVKQILDSHKSEQDALNQRAMTARDALETAITGGAFDEGTIRARFADVAAVEADQTVARARIYNEVLQVLTADQVTKLKDLQSRMKGRRGQGRQRPQA